jgi:hypothetical protein
MPEIHLSTFGTRATMPVRDPTGTPLLLPRIQLRCLVRLPNLTMPRDGIIDTGSPFTWFPEAIWRHFQPGVDYEELPFEPGYTAPRGQTAGWNFTFRMARMLQPIGLHDLSTELERHGVIAQFANGNPPIPPGSQRPAVVVIGLWGGLLEGTSLRIATDATTGHLAAALEW